MHIQYELLPGFLIPDDTSLFQIEISLKFKVVKFPFL